MRVSDREVILAKLIDLLPLAQALSARLPETPSDDLLYDLDNIEQDIHAALYDLRCLLEEYTETLAPTDNAP